MKKGILILGVLLSAYINGMAQTAKEACSETTSRGFYQTLCNAVSNQNRDNEGNGRNYHWYEVLIECASGVEPLDSDSVVIKKVQGWWNKNRMNCTCDKANFTIPRGNILKLGIQNTFEAFIKKIVRFYKLDINFVDPSDGKTVLDYTKEQYDRLYKIAPDSPKTKDFERIFKVLRDYGALYKSELK